jgi:hypothetical protein
MAIRYRFSFTVVVEEGTPEAKAYYWLSDTLKGSDRELPDNIFSVQTVPTVEIVEDN